MFVDCTDDLIEVSIYSMELDEVRSTSESKSDSVVVVVSIEDVANLQHLLDSMVDLLKTKRVVVHPSNVVMPGKTNACVMHHEA